MHGLRVARSSCPLCGPHRREHRDRDVIVHIRHARQAIVGGIVSQGRALVNRSDGCALQTLVDLYDTGSGREKREVEVRQDRKTEGTGRGSEENELNIERK